MPCQFSQFSIPITRPVRRCVGVNGTGLGNERFLVLARIITKLIEVSDKAAVFVIGRAGSPKG